MTTCETGDEAEGSNMKNLSRYVIVGAAYLHVYRKESRGVECDRSVSGSGGCSSRSFMITFSVIRVLCSDSDHTLPCLFTYDICACSACFLL